VVPGYYIATLLSCLNLEENKFLEGADQFVPEKHYLRGGRVNPEAITPGAEFAISTFGHGSHACPGKRFAIMLAKTIVSSLLDSYKLTFPRDTKVKIIETQMGAVGRPTDPVIVHYQKL